jgi:hypothetical protein
MESATKTSFAIVDMPLAAEPPDLKRYDESEGMDEGGIVGEAARKRVAATYLTKENNRLVSAGLRHNELGRYNALNPEYMTDEEKVEHGFAKIEGGCAKPKRTRAARAKGGAGSNVKTEGGAGSGGIYLLVDADKKATTVEPENLRGAIARTWMDSTLTLYKAVPVNAEYVVK